MWGDLLNSVSPGVVATIVALSLGYHFFSRKKVGDEIKLPPCAPGNMIKHTKMMSGDKLPQFLLGLLCELQTSVFQLSIPMRPFSRVFMVGEAKTFRAVLMDSLSEKPPEIYSSFNNTNGMGIETIFTMNGAVWHAKRKAIAPAFSSNQVKRMATVANEKMKQWIQTKLNSTNVDASFDVTTEMTDIVLSAIVVTAFEYEMSAVEKAHFCHELELALIEFTLKSNPMREAVGWFISERRRAFAAGRNLMNFAKKMMDAYRKKGPTHEAYHGFKGSSIRRGKALEIIFFLIASHDTTSFSIAWILLELAKNLKEQRKLRESLGQLPSEALKRVINEGMRLHLVAAAGSVRTIGKDFMTDKNEVLPKGSIVFLLLILLLRNPDIFENPDKFDPSRWEEPTREMLDAFNPFSLGKQNCMGQSLAKAETLAIVPRICSQFELTVEDEGGVDYFLTLKPVGARLSARRL
ncbi:hypothetical protein ACHAWF_002159 [Thalassiosira exigua]